MSTIPACKDALAGGFSKKTFIYKIVSSEIPIDFDQKGSDLTYVIHRTARQEVYTAEDSNSCHKDPDAISIAAFA
jgi:hypothetical protein